MKSWGPNPTYPMVMTILLALVPVDGLLLGNKQRLINSRVSREADVSYGKGNQLVPTMVSIS